MVCEFDPCIRLSAVSTEPALDPLSLSLYPSPPLTHALSSLSNKLKKTQSQGAWVAQLVKHPTLAQVMISYFMSLSPTSGSVLTSQSLDPALDSMSPSLSAPPQLHSASLSKTNKHFKKI